MIVALRVGVEVQKLSIYFFLTSSDSFAVGCVVQKQTQGKTNRRYYFIVNGTLHPQRHSVQTKVLPVTTNDVGKQYDLPAL